MQMKSVNEQMESEAKEQRQKLKLQDYDNAMRRIKDATGVSDVNEIIQKFQTQGDTLSNLKELQQEND